MNFFFIFYKRDISAAGGGQSDSSLSAMDQHIASLIGETSVSGIICDGDTEDPLPDPEAIPETPTDGKSSFIFRNHIQTWTTSKYFFLTINITNIHYGSKVWVP